MLLKPNIIFLFLFLFCTVLSKAQADDLKSKDYSLADKTAIEFPKRKYKNVSEIAGPLTENLKTEHEKFRAIFRWITENIQYDKSAANTAEANKIVRKNKAVCQGFSNLLKEMCESVNIPCKVVVGYTKTDVKDINRKLKKTDHAWNIVTLYGKKYLVDVTWATSKFNVVTRKFEKDFDEHYFLTPPEKFILDHLPEKKEDQLLEKTVSKKRFSSSPLLYADFFHLNMAKVNPEKGSMKVKAGKPFVFEFSTENGSSFSKAAVLVDNDKYLTPVDLKNNRLEYYFEQEGNHDIIIYLEEKAVAEYLVKSK